MYPRLKIYLKRIEENTRVVRQLCASHGIHVMGVTKACCGAPELAEAYLAGGLAMIGDSRVANLKKLKNIEAEKWLIRPPMLSEIEDLVRYADVSLQSEMETVRAINKECEKQGKRHKIILMMDLGDIREGYVDEEELIAAAVETEKLSRVDLYGIGTNLTCFSFIQADEEKMERLAEMRKKVENAAGHTLEIVSGGNSAALDLMMRGGICEGVDNFRLGESLLFGKERSRYTFLPGTRNDGFILECEVVEAKVKPSLPWGTAGVDSYGRKPVFTNRGEKRKKVICAIGRQDFDAETATPVDEGIFILGASSDHLMLDVTDSVKEYKVGDILELRLGYFSVLRAFTSPYVEKIFLKK